MLHGFVRKQGWLQARLLLLVWGSPPSSCFRRGQESTGSQQPRKNSEPSACRKQEEPVAQRAAGQEQHGSLPHRLPLSQGGAGQGEPCPAAGGRERRAGIHLRAKPAPCAKPGITAWLQGNPRHTPRGTAHQLSCHREERRLAFWCQKMLKLGLSPSSWKGRGCCRTPRQQSPVHQ